MQDVWEVPTHPDGITSIMAVLAECQNCQSAILEFGRATEDLSSASDFACRSDGRNLLTWSSLCQREARFYATAAIVEDFLINIHALLSLIGRETTDLKEESTTTSGSVGRHCPGYSVAQKVAIGMRLAREMVNDLSSQHESHYKRGEQTLSEMWSSLEEAGEVSHER